MLCAPVHDALLMQAPLDRLDDDIARLQEIMTEAGRVILEGFEVRTDAEVVRYPMRYVDPRGRVMWERVMDLITKIEERQQQCAVA